MRIHLVAYTARTADGTTETGVARVYSERQRPSWRECALAIPGYVTGRYLGEVETFRLSWETEAGPTVRELSAAAVEKVGAVVMRSANRGAAWNIAVTNAAGDDVTADFRCFV